MTINEVPNMWLYFRTEWVQRNVCLKMKGVVPPDSSLLRRTTDDGGEKMELTL